MKQPLAWVIWLGVVLAMLTIARNPLYLILILLCILFVSLALRSSRPDALPAFPVWKFAGWILALSTAFNMLTSHYGETVLFSIPGKFPLLSGNVTLEAGVYGLINGLVLLGMIASFSVLNQALSVRDLIGLIPRPFFPVALVTSIAVTYVPTTRRQFQQIQEAQAVRGHQMRSWRDWLPLLLPLLVGGLEHAMQLAEAMTARGFGSHNLEDNRRAISPRLVLLPGLLLLGAGWLTGLAGSRWPAWAAMLGGALLILVGLVLSGRQYTRTAYHRPVWNWVDALGVCSALLVVGAAFLGGGSGISQLYYEPYPRLSLPLFSPLTGSLLLFLLIPGIISLAQSAHAENGQENERSTGHSGG